MPPAPVGGSAAKAREQLIDLLTPLVEQAGYDLDDLAVTSAGRRSLVRVTVDADGGIDLDAVADVSRIVSDALDDAAGLGNSVLAGAYTLEVSSPGIDRPLTEPRHWRRAIGRLVKVDVAGHSSTGRVKAVSESGVSLESAGRTKDVAWSDLGRGRVQVEFSREGE